MCVSMSDCPEDLQNKGFKNAPKPFHPAGMMKKEWAYKLFENTFRNNVSLWCYSVQNDVKRILIFIFCKYIKK